MPWKKDRDKRQGLITYINRVDIFGCFLVVLKKKIIDELINNMFEKKLEITFQEK